MLFLRMPYVSYKYSLLATSFGVIAGFSIALAVFMGFMHQWIYMVIFIVSGVLLYLIHYKYGDKLNKKAFENRVKWDVELCEEMSNKSRKMYDICYNANKEFRMNCIKLRRETEKKQ